MAPGRTRTIDMKKRSSDRKRIATQKAQVAREALLNEPSDSTSETAINMDSSTIENGGLASLMQIIRADFASLAEILT